MFLDVKNSFVNALITEKNYDSHPEGVDKEGFV